MIDKRYYEKLGGFAYLLGELRKKLGREQTDILVNSARAQTLNCLSFWLSGSASVHRRSEV